MSNNKFLITQTLLSAYDWVFKKDEGYAEFLETLENKKQQQQQDKFLDGIEFENTIQAVCDGAELDTSHKWYKPIMEIVSEVRGGAYQVKLSRDLNVDGVTYVIYGKLDFLKAGTIYDTKFSKHYAGGENPNKYLDSPQHGLYYYLCPNADRFTYLISDGKDVYRESYGRDECESLEVQIRALMKYLTERDLMHIYTENWRSLYD